MELHRISPRSARPKRCYAVYDTARQAVVMLLEHGHRRRRRRGRRTFQGLRAGRSSGQTKREYTAASGRHDHATFREGADASVRCLGLEARLLATSDEAWAAGGLEHRPIIAFTF